MPVTIACPKCQSRYQIAETVIGKTIECKKCSTRFTAAVAPTPVAVGAAVAGGAAPARRPAKLNPRYSEGAPAEELARLGLDGPIRRAPDPLSEDLIPPAKDILGNFAADPGFGAPGTGTASSRRSSKSSNSLDELVENPYAREIEASRKKSRMAQGEPGYEFKSLKTLDRVVRWSGWGFLLCGILSLAGIYGAFYFKDWEKPLEIAAMIALGTCCVLSVSWSVSLMLFVFRANSNLRALGTKNLAFSPGLAVGSWFIPFLAIVWPWQALGEIYKASHSPYGTKWKKEPFPGVVIACWVCSLIGLFFIAFPLFGKITKTIYQKQERFAS